MRAALEGIMYPKDAKKLVLSSFSKVLDSGYSCACGAAEPYVLVPRGSWERFSRQYSRAFEAVCGTSPSRIYVLGVLQKGPVAFDDGPLVYAPSSSTLEGSDWRVPLFVPSELEPFVSLSDDVCSEESGLEVLAPYLDALFPSVPVCWLLASGPRVPVEIVEFIRNDFSSRVFVSSFYNEGEVSLSESHSSSSVWQEAFGR